MIQPPTPRRPKRFAEPEITSAISVWRSMLAASVNSVEKQRRAYRAHDPRLEMFGIILLAPPFAVLTVVILLVLPAGVLVHRIFIEEAVLTEVIGRAYADYAARTKRLVPGLW